MKHFCQRLMSMMVAWNVLPAWAEIDVAMLIRKWCLVHQSMLGMI